jgi:CHAT domain-containing protein
VTSAPRWRVHGLGLPELTEETVRGWVERYFGAYDARDADPYAWERTLDEVTGELWEAAIGPIVETLRSAYRADRAVLVPVGLLGLLPLHAAWTGSGTLRRYALDEVGLTYAPNARVLTAARHRAARGAGDRLLVVGAPGTGARRLSDVDAEIAVVRAHFDDVREGADRAGILAALPGATVLHVAAHGHADIGDPLDSALELAGGETLTLRDVFGLRLPGGLRLAVLSACETGVVAADVPDEAVGLAAGLLQAGAAGVVATLWAVPDRTAAALVALFYRAWRGDGDDPADALRAAQRRLRDATNDELSTEIPGYAAHRPPGEAAGRFWGRSRPFAAARHWAAFSYVGA